MTVALVDYGSGNLHSAAKAFERAAREGGSDAQVVVTYDAALVAPADIEAKIGKLGYRIER